MNLILIAQDPDFCSYLDEITVSSLNLVLLPFPPFTTDQLFDHVLSRAKEGLFRNSFDNRLIELIAI